MRFQALIILLFFTTISFGQNAKDSLQFSIYFTRCFQNDTLSLTINGVNIFEKKVISTDSSDGVADYVVQTKSAFWLGQNKKLSTIKIKKINLLEIKLNSVSENFDVSLKRGKHILVDKCHGNGSFIGWSALSLSQSKTAAVSDYPYNN